MVYLYQAIFSLQGFCNHRFKFQYECSQNFIIEYLACQYVIELAVFLPKVQSNPETIFCAKLYFSLLRF